MSETIRDDQTDPLSTEKEPRELDSELTLSPALARLIEEVRHEKAEGPNTRYNRFHNRHNRSR